MKAGILALAAAAIALPMAAHAAEKHVAEKHAAKHAASRTVIVLTTSEDGTSGAPVGAVTIRDTPQGLFLDPMLAGLTPGVHGWHIHAVGDCSKNGMAAGGHLDPKKTGKHLGPDARGGHMGDLPVLVVDEYGKATLPVVAPHLKLKDVVGHALMIHAGGDNYSDEPKALGGGGARVACGVIR